MRIRRLSTDRYRGIRRLSFCPGFKSVILGANNSGKSTVLEALDLLLHPGLGRPRPAPTKVDYYNRESSRGFLIEAVIGDLPAAFVPRVRQQLEGWREESEELVAEPEGEGLELVIRNADAWRTRLRPRPRGREAGNHVSTVLAKRAARIGWVFDGRTRDPFRQLAFCQGGLFDRLFRDIELGPTVPPCAPLSVTARAWS